MSSFSCRKKISIKQDKTLNAHKICISDRTNLNFTFKGTLLHHLGNFTNCSGLTLTNPVEWEFKVNRIIYRYVTGLCQMGEKLVYVAEVRTAVLRNEKEVELARQMSVLFSICITNMFSHKVMTSKLFHNLSPGSAASICTLMERQTDTLERGKKYIEM